MSQFAMPAESDRWATAPPSLFRFVGRRAAFLLVSLAFAGAFCWNYMEFQVVALSWFNVYYTPTPLSAWIMGFIIFLIPGLFVPTELVRPSSFAVLAQYMLVLMPVCFVPMFRQEMPVEHCILLAASFAVAILILLGMNKAPRKVLPILRLRPEIAWPFFGGLYIALNGIVALMGPRWRLVSFADVYDIARPEAAAYAGSIFAYAYSNLGCAMNPFLLAYALARRNYSLAAISCVMEIYLYGYGGNKAMVFVPPLVIGTYFLVERFRQPATKLIIGLVMLSVLSTAAYARNPSLLSYAVNGLLEERIIAMAGQNTAGFDYFAYNYGFTYWSHVSGVNKFVRYPFKQDLGNEVGFLEQGSITQGNTGFLASDGLSALGLVGVTIIACVVGGYFWLVDCVASGHDSAFAVASYSGMAFVLVNVGFFTSLLSDGAFLIVVLLQFMPLIQTATAGQVPDRPERYMPSPAF